MSRARPIRPRDPPPVRSASWRLRGTVAAVVLAVMTAAATGQELIPRPESTPAVTPPEMYIADPLDADGFAGIPSGIQAEMLPGWPRWFAGASGLVMTRTLPEGAATMQPLGGLSLSTSDASATWPGGVDLHVGRWFGPRQHNAVELIYWGVFGIGTSGSVASPTGGIQAIPNTSGVTVNGTAASTILGNATGQRISRSDLVNDVEINWLYSLWERPEFQPRERRVNLMWLAGFRFFELQDVLTLTTTSGADQLDFNVATNNNLYGGQVGAKFDWRFAQRVRFSAVPKMLVAGNAITNTSSLAASDGTSAVFAGTGAPVNVHSTLGVFSWLGSVDAAVAWDVTERWSLWMGYRVVGVGNVAQADQQWPTLITNASSLSGVTAGGSTILHGGFAGFEGRY